MHTQARKPVAAFAAILLAAAASTASRAHAACGEHRDFLTRADPLLASVRPADCATLFAEAPQFTWPLQDGARGYTVALTFPDEGPITVTSVTAPLRCTKNVMTTRPRSDMAA